MYIYEEYGMGDTKILLQNAYKNHYAVPALNFIAMEQLNAIGDAILEKQSPVIVMVAPKHYRQFEIQIIVRMVQALIERLREKKCQCPVSLHLDHGNTFEECRIAIDNGFSSVMIDGSGLPLEENIKLTRSVVDYAHRFGVAVEGEAGALSGAEDIDDESGTHCYTSAEEAERFIHGTGADSLAVSVGTMHGLKKIIDKNRGSFQGIRYDILQQIERRIPGIPLVLHGCSSLPAKYVEMINQYHGKIEPTVGIPDACLEKACETAVCKINIASDGWIPSTAITRKVLAEHPGLIDSSLYRQQIREELGMIYQHKMDIMGSTGWGGGVKDKQYDYAAMVD